jgi:hypothetical protein
MIVRRLICKEMQMELSTYVAGLSSECRENHDTKRVNRSFENVVQFKYLGTTATNQNLIQEEVKRRLNSGNACHHSA